MEIEETLRLLNSWWISGKIREDLAKSYKRQAFEEAHSLLTKYKEVIVLTGLRRVGKTTIMYQLMDKLLDTTNPLNILYFTFDYGPAELVSVLDSYQKITGVDWKRNKIFVFLDEIQILDNWGSQIKVLHDSMPNIRFIISGSASLQLERSAMHNLAGRHFLIDVPVLSLKEYYSLKHDKVINNTRLYYDEISSDIDEYITKPFPELAKVTDRVRAYEYINESIVSKVISLDLSKEFDNVDISMLNSLTEIFYSDPGMILNVDSLSRTLAKRKQEVERHIYMLEFSKLIRIIKNYRPSMVSESRKLRKVYPYDISLAIAKNPSLDNGRITETLIISRLEIKRYWREGTREVDALFGEGKNMLPIEIKASDNFKEDYKKDLNYFIEKFKSKSGLLLYNGKRKIEGKVTAVNIKDILLFGKDAFV
jgi:hypothetical protein